MQNRQKGTSIPDTSQITVTSNKDVIDQMLCTTKPIRRKACMYVRSYYRLVSSILLDFFAVLTQLAGTERPSQQQCLNISISPSRTMNTAGSKAKEGDHPTQKEDHDKDVPKTTSHNAQPRKDPRKIPGHAQDLFGMACFFILFLSVFFIGTFITRHHGVEEKDKSTTTNPRKVWANRRAAKGIQDVPTTFQQPLTSYSHVIYKRRTVGCGLYSAPTSIPTKDRLMGIYSAKDYSEGNTVIQSMWTLPLDISIGNAVKKIRIPQYLLLMRHHPSFYNVRLEMDTANINNNTIALAAGGGRFVATKTILPGDELFFNVDDLDDDVSYAYKNSIFSNHPTKETFADVNKITKDILAAIPIKSGKRAMKGRNTPVTEKNQRSFQRVMDVAPILQLMKKTLVSYDEKVAHLLPVTEDAAERVFIFGSASSLVHPRRPMEWVHEFGACVDGVLPTRINGAELTAYANRKMNKGDVIITAPLFVMHNPMEEVHRWNFHCPYLHDLYLCPMTFAGFIQQKSTLGEKDLPTNNNHSESDSCKIAEIDNVQTISSTNARYEWSDKSPWHAGSNDYISSYLFDFIATQDIEEGEEVRIRLDNLFLIMGLFV